MPRGNKQIDQGRLDETASSSQGPSWSKYGGPETVDGHRGTPLSQGADTVEVTVDDITITDSPDGIDSKYTTRGTSAHDASVPGDEPVAKPVEIVTEWVITKTIENRTYHRSDRLVKVQLES